MALDDEDKFCHPDYNKMRVNGLMISYSALDYQLRIEWSRFKAWSAHCVVVVIFLCKTLSTQMYKWVPEKNCMLGANKNVTLEFFLTMARTVHLLGHGTSTVLFGLK